MAPVDKEFAQLVAWLIQWRAMVAQHIADGSTAGSRAAIAKRIRHRAQYEIQRRVKYDHSWVRSATCGQCWCRTNSFCVKRFICKVDVCGTCAVTGHILRKFFPVQRAMPSDPGAGGGYCAMALFTAGKLALRGPRRLLRVV